MLILSVDGGGVRGMLTAKLIARIETELPGWTKQVDLFAGASTGAIIALALAYGLSPLDVLEFYRAQLPAIFKQSWRRRFTTLWRAKYDNTALIAALEGVFGESTVDQLEKDVLIATYYLGVSKPIFRPARAKFYDRNNTRLRIADLALWSGSAPTYFPSADRHVDGGLSANNSAVCAMAYQENKGTPLSEMSVLSLGTGAFPVVLEGGDRGLTYWGQNLLVPFVDGSVDVADFQARQFLGAEGTYHRLQPKLYEEIELDDVSKLDYLMEWADQVDLQPTIDWITSQVGPVSS